MQQRELRFVSLMAPNAQLFCNGLAGYLGNRLNRPVALVADTPWQEAERRLYGGQADLGIVCGLQYVYAVEHALRPGVAVLAAPVMRGPRYGGRPVYFTEVVVRAGSVADSLMALRGSTLAFNEPTSHSGYMVVRSALAAREQRQAFFGQVIASGAHERSLELLLAGHVDATAIDSTVLEQELRVRPSLAKAIRVVETLGPSPIPPVVVSRALPPEIVRGLRAALLGMHRDTAGRAVLAEAQVHRFVRIADADYNPIRTMARQADAVAAWL